jgi:hypothetical protein
MSIRVTFFLDARKQRTTSQVKRLLFQNMKSQIHEYPNIVIYWTYKFDDLNLNDN